VIVLGIETSTETCSVGLAGDFGVPVERSIVESRIHSEKLLTLVQAVCAGQKLKLSQLDGVAVSIGPGSFTGLRIGLSSAKGLCYALQKPLAAVPTFEAVATAVCTSHPESVRIVVCVDAKQGEYYIGVYEKNGTTVKVWVPVQRKTLDEAVTLANTANATLVTDRTEEAEKIAGDDGLVRNILPYCRGGIVASLGYGRLKADETVDIGSIEPYYLKDFIVQKNVMREND
jgi:tRNA threonylcarbamoyladenosine biosynthesis protein TsaB